MATFDTLLHRAPRSRLPGVTHEAIAQMAREIAPDDSTSPSPSGDSGVALGDVTASSASDADFGSTPPVLAYRRASRDAGAGGRRRSKSRQYREAYGSGLESAEAADVAQRRLNEIEKLRAELNAERHIREGLAQQNAELTRAVEENKKRHNEQLSFYQDKAQAALAEERRKMEAALAHQAEDERDMAYTKERLLASERRVQELERQVETQRTEARVLREQLEHVSDEKSKYERLAESLKSQYDQMDMQTKNLQALNHSLTSQIVEVQQASNVWRSKEHRFDETHTELERLRVEFARVEQARAAVQERCSQLDEEKRAMKEECLRDKSDADKARSEIMWVKDHNTTLKARYHDLEQMHRQCEHTINELRMDKVKFVDEWTEKERAKMEEQLASRIAVGLAEVRSSLRLKESDLARANENMLKMIAEKEEMEQNLQVEQHKMSQLRNEFVSLEATYKIRRSELESTIITLQEKLKVYQQLEHEMDEAITTAAENDGRMALEDAPAFACLLSASQRRIQHTVGLAAETLRLKRIVQEREDDLKAKGKQEHELRTELGKLRAAVNSAGQPIGYFTAALHEKDVELAQRHAHIEDLENKIGDLRKENTALHEQIESVVALKADLVRMRAQVSAVVRGAGPREGSMYRHESVHMGRHDAVGSTPYGGRGMEKGYGDEWGPQHRVGAFAPPEQRHAGRQRERFSGEEAGPLVVIAS